jgi:hypothetical protein
MINKKSGQVEIISTEGTSVFLYTHDLGDQLVNDVYQSLKVGTRWDDADYLARIVFCRMVPPEQLLDDKGFGIGTLQYADINLLIVLDCSTQTIKVISSLLEHKDKWEMSFTEFLDKYSSAASL